MPTVRFFPWMVIGAVFFSTTELVSTTALSSPAGWARLSGTLNRSSDVLTPSSFTVVKGALIAVCTESGQFGGSPSRRIEKPPFLPASEML